VGEVDLASFRALLSPDGERVLEEVAARGGADERTMLGTLTALRRRYDAGLVSAALTQVRLRDRAQAKFGADAAGMYFTPAGVEQATRAVVAERHARRYADAGVLRVLDLCCGIGGDLVAFARAGLRVHGVDRDPLTLEVARANAAALGVAEMVTLGGGDVAEVPLGGWPAAFVDPGRRDGSGGRRVFDPRGYSPPFSFVGTLAAAVPLTGAKVAPGIPHELVPPGVEAEWVSVAGEVKEAALWYGALATVPRRATLLPSGATLVGRGSGPPPVGSAGPWLYEPDGAVIRAGLVAEVVAALPGGRLLDPTIAYVAAERSVPTPFARGYRVAEALPFSLKRLRDLLRARDIGEVTVKKRGSAVDPDVLRRELRLSGHSHAVVVLTRVAGAPTALVCDPPAN